MMHMLLILIVAVNLMITYIASEDLALTTIKICIIKITIK